MLIGVLAVLLTTRVHSQRAHSPAASDQALGTVWELSPPVPRQPLLIQGNLLSLSNPFSAETLHSRPIVTASSPLPDVPRITTAAAPAVNGPAAEAAPAQSPTPADPTVTARPTAPRVRPLFTSYTIQEGDTLQKIAARTGISPQYLKANNPLIDDGDRLLVGQQLRIPMANGVIHDVHSGETLLEIAERYGSTLQALLAANEIADPNAISVRAQIFVPHAKLPEPPAHRQAPPESRPIALSEEASPTPAATRTATATRTPAPTRTPTPTATTTSNTATAGTGGGSRCSVWPASGPLSTNFGAGHAGIDIDLFNAVGSPIVACAPGTVTFAGGDPCCSYGLYVVIDHGGGFQTLYAHCSKLSVSKGQTVTAGQVVCAAGSTGYSTGPHLHFETRVGGVPQNPLRYLP